MDTYIKCSIRLKNIELEEIEYIKYFWKSYINTYKNKYNYDKTHIIDPQKYIDIYCNISYDINTDILYNMIIKMIQEKYGDEITNQYIQHVCYKKSYKELNISPALVKQIKKYILSELS